MHSTLKPNPLLLLKGVDADEGEIGDEVDVVVMEFVVHNVGGIWLLLSIKLLLLLLLP